MANHFMTDILIAWKLFKRIYKNVHMQWTVYGLWFLFHVT
jgi:hypothetical protein